MKSVEYALAWLKKLHDSIWVEKRRIPFDYCNPHQPKILRECTRRIDPDELRRLLAFVKKFKLPVTMENCDWGLSIAMRVWGPEPPALYPGIELKPESVLLLPTQALPLTEATRMPDRTFFEDGWRVFSPLTHSDLNRDLLRRSNLPQPEDKATYEY